MTETQNLPRTLQALAADAAAIGGELRAIKPRFFEVVLPCREDGKWASFQVTQVVPRQNGKNVISGTAAARREIAYWARQSRP